MKTCPPSFPETNPHTAEASPMAQHHRAGSDAAHDAGLVRSFKAGDESAFTEIVKRHYASIRALAYRTLHDDGDADEVAQDTFIRAHRCLHNFRGDCSLTTWLFRIGLNLARNRYWFHHRRHRHNTLSLDRSVAENSMATLTSSTATPVFESTTHDFLALVAQCMERLDDRQREILMMRTTLDLSYEEIAGQLHINVGTVKSRISRARERLREMLHQLAPEFGREASPIDFFEVERPQPAAALA